MNALDRYLTDKGIQSQDFAAQVGVSVSSISRLRRGLQMPTIGLIEKIVAETHGAVSADSFLSQEGRTLIAAASIAPAEPAAQPEPVLNG